MVEPISIITCVIMCVGAVVSMGSFALSLHNCVRAVKVHNRQEESENAVQTVVYLNPRAPRPYFRILALMMHAQRHNATQATMSVIEIQDPVTQEVVPVNLVLSTKFMDMQFHVNRLYAWRRFQIRLNDNSIVLRFATPEDQQLFHKVLDVTDVAALEAQVLDHRRLRPQRNVSSVRA